MNRSYNSSLIAPMCALAMSLSPLAIAEDEPPTNGEMQKIVISLQQNPADEEGLEAACVALQLGSGLLMSGQADVTLFATLDGVYIADKNTYKRGGRPGWKDDWYEQDRSYRYPRRHKPDGPICETFRDGVLGSAPLRDILDGFLNLGGEVLLCPLCYAVRQEDGYKVIEDPAIYVANPIPLLNEADKVIDY